MENLQQCSKLGYPLYGNFGVGNDAKVTRDKFINNYELCEMIIMV